MGYKIVVFGKSKKIAFLMKGNTCECEKGLRAVDNLIKKRLWAIMKRLADAGYINNDEIFKYVGNGIWEFKPDSIRVYCFFDDDLVICTHCAAKQKQRRTKIEIKKACGLRNQYLEKKGD